MTGATATREAVQDELRARYLAGESIPQLARALGWSTRAVRLSIYQADDRASARLAGQLRA